MNIKFGNLTVAQFEKRVGTQFTDEERTTLESLMEAAQARAPFNRPVSFYPRGEGWAA